MRVTRIEELDKTRSKIYLDGEFAFVLYKGEIRQFCITEDGELSGENCERILGEILPKRAKLRALHLLQKREYTVAQLREKLEQGLYPAQVVDEALQYVESHHYTDDMRYALQYITFHEETRSRRRIEQDLGAKGISREQIREAWQRWEDQGFVQNEELLMEKLLQKRKFDPEKADFVERQKQAAFLMRKGFSTEKIRKVLQCS